MKFKFFFVAAITTAFFSQSCKDEVYNDAELAAKLDSVTSLLDSVSTSVYTDSYGPLTSDGMFTYNEKEYDYTRSLDQLLGSRSQFLSITPLPEVSEAPALNAREPQSEKYLVTVAFTETGTVSFDGPSGPPNGMFFTFVFDPKKGQESIEEFLCSEIFEMQLEDEELTVTIEQEGTFNSSRSDDDNVTITSFSYDFDTKDLSIAFGVDDPNGEYNNFEEAAKANYAFEGTLVWGSSDSFFR